MSTLAEALHRALPRRGLLVSSRAASLALFLVALGFYTYTLQPSLSWGDGVKLQREAITGESMFLTALPNADWAPDPFPFARLGIAAWDHPLYVIIGYTLVHALPGVNHLWLVNMLSALFGAGTVALLFRLCLIRTRSMTAALVAALALAVSHTFWFHAVTAEVYTLFACLLLLFLNLHDHYERTGSFAALAGSSFALGLGGANHLLGFLVLPAAVLYLLLFRESRPEFRLRPRQYVLLALAFVAGFSPYLIQIVRLLRSFTVEEMLGPVLGTVFLRGSVSWSLPGLGQSVLTYAMFLFLQFGPVGVAVGFYGLAAGGRAGGDSAALWRKTLALYLVYLAFGLVYRVTDQFAFFLGAHVLFALGIGLGMTRLLALWPQRRQYWLVGAMAASIAGLPFFYQALPGLAHRVGVTDETFRIPQVGVGLRDGLAFYINPNKRGDDSSYRFGRETLLGMPPQALIVAEWYTDTDEYFVFSYFLDVEHLRPDVELVAWPLNDPFSFDPRLVAQTLQAEVGQRPVFLASLSQQFYDASALEAQYCIVPEDNLYRVYPTAADAPTACLR